MEIAGLLVAGFSFVTLFAIFQGIWEDARNAPRSYGGQQLNVGLHITAARLPILTACVFAFILGIGLAGGLIFGMDQDYTQLPM